MGGELIRVLKYWVIDGVEINNFIKVWLSIFISLCYCYTAGKIAPRGTPRFLTIIPVVCLFLTLPLHLHTMHLGGTTAFFIAWLANFKLLMFAFAKGPLSDPSISLPQFIAIACLPIKIQQHPPPKTSPISQNKSDPSFLNGNGQNQIKQDPSSHHQTPSSIPRSKAGPPSEISQKGQKSSLNYAIRVLRLALVIKVHDYSAHFHPMLFSLVYCVHIYFGLEIILAIVAALARVFLGFELEPQFNEPFLSTSLQDFWGRRWNLMVTRILNPSVYQPLLKMSAPIIGRKWAPIPAVLGAFVVSALMHELIFYYLARDTPTWKCAGFFILHGVCLVLEITIKKVVSDRWRPPRFVASAMTVVFVLFTICWLFLPELLVRCRADVRAFEELAAIGAFVRDVGQALTNGPLEY